MKPETTSQTVLGITRAKAKMFEYGVAEEHHIRIPQDPKDLFALTIGIVGEASAWANRANENQEYLDSLQESLRFASRFFDSYIQSKLDPTLDSYLLILASSAFYLAEMPGSSDVLIRSVGEQAPDLDAGGIERFVFSALYPDAQASRFPESVFSSESEGLLELFRTFASTGNQSNVLLEKASSLRKKVYSMGSPRQLLMADIAVALTRRKIENSVWVALPRYSDLPSKAWQSAISDPAFIRELWPAQKLLGEQGILRGRSAVIQMPTSAGKTKATELVIRSAFLNRRADLAVIVAPFRALCHEISSDLFQAFRNDDVQVDGLSDVLQGDYDFGVFLDGLHVLVTTPEKLLYVLRHNPELPTRIGLALFDEGHQFDSGTRGITYELLVTSLNRLFPEECQKLLISAVIPNAESVGAWMSGPETANASGENLNPTLRSVSFTSWQDTLGRLEFVEKENIDTSEFFVPRLISKVSLDLLGRERKPRFFPTKDNGKSIALYLALKLCQNGGVAIFCGRKSTVTGICADAEENYRRGLTLVPPSNFSDEEEVSLLHSLYSKHLGDEALQSKAAAIGIFSHHGDTPSGLRLAVEFAMRKNLIRVVVCTSTLAQGVNLPIKYLLVTGVYQGQERIKIRDFHNLLGRAGRAGMHTEGTVIFTDNQVYDLKDVPSQSWRWQQARELLDPSSAEACESTLLSLFSRFRSDDLKKELITDPLDFVTLYIESPEDINGYAARIYHDNGDNKFTESGMQSQIDWKINLITTVESFLLAELDSEGDLDMQTQAKELASQTLAYYLASEDDRTSISEMFRLLAAKIETTVPDVKRRSTYSKTLLGINDLEIIRLWVEENSTRIGEVSTPSDLVALLWEMIEKFAKNKLLKKCTSAGALLEATTAWIRGDTFSTIHDSIVESGAKLIAGQQKREITLDHVVSFCESGLGFDSALIVGAIAEFIEAVAEDGDEESGKLIRFLQRALKYGLPNDAAFGLHKDLFPDRVVVMDLIQSLSIQDETSTSVLDALETRGTDVVALIAHYPRYFQMQWREFIAS